MINEINEKIAEQFGLDFDDVLDDFYDDSSVNHRRGSSFYKTSIIEINEEYYPDVDKELYGFWETNEYIWDDDYGFDKEDIDTLTRVALKERTIVTQYWERVISQPKSIITTVEKMYQIKKLMDEVESQVREAAQTIENMDGALYRMLTEGCADTFKHMSKNYHSQASGFPIDSWKKQLDNAHELARKNTVISSDS